MPSQRLSWVLHFEMLGEITELAGCDRLTISPALLEQLQKSNTPVPTKLSPEASAALCTDAAVHFDEAGFRWALNEDAMATEKLAEGIRNFGADIVKLEGVPCRLYLHKNSGSDCHGDLLLYHAVDI